MPSSTLYPPERRARRAVPTAPEAGAAYGRASDVCTASARVWRPFHPGGPGIVCVHARGAGPVPLHAHEQVQLTVPLTPCRLVDSRARAHAMRPGQLAVVGAMEVHGLSGTGGSWETLEVLLDSLTAVRLRAAGSRARATTVDGSHDDAAWHAEASATVVALVPQLRQSRRAEEVDDRLLSAIGRLLAGHRSSPAGGDTRTAAGVERARAYLHAHVTEPVALDALARAAFLSKYHLVRAFARAHGLTPHAYQMQLRLARARTLIERGAAVTHATYAAGFADQSHLTRRFREYFGFTPAAYARALGSPGADLRRDSAPQRRATTSVAA